MNEIKTVIRNKMISNEGKKRQILLVNRCKLIVAFFSAVHHHRLAHNRSLYQLPYK